MPSIIDRTSEIRQGNYSPGRRNVEPAVFVLHDTVGSGSSPDRNDLPLTVEQFAVREEATARYLLSSGQASIHFLIGPEATGARIQALCREQDTAWHAAGQPIRNTYTTPSGVLLVGQLPGDNVSRLNRYSIGAEIWGAPDEPIYPRQQAALIYLTQYLGAKYQLKSQQVNSHMFFQRDRTDGEKYLAIAREALKPTVPVVLPFGYQLTKEGWLLCTLTGKILKGAILHYLATLNGSVAAPTLLNWANRIETFTNMFGLPVSDEHSVDGVVEQYFERNRLVYNTQNDGPADKWAVVPDVHYPNPFTPPWEV